MRFYSRQGFTLLELLLVIGLIALLTALVVPNFKPVLHDAQLEQALQVLQADLMQTRQTARAMEKPTSLKVISATDYQIYIESTLSSSKRLADGCSFESPPANSSVVFDKHGSPGDVPVTFVIENRGSTGEVKVKASTGRIEVSYP